MRLLTLDAIVYTQTASFPVLGDECGLRMRLLHSIMSTIACGKIEGILYSGGFRAARLPGQATHAAHAVSLWVEKNPVPPPNRQALGWSVVLAVGRLCPIIPQDNIAASNKHN